MALIPGLLMTYFGWFAGYASSGSGLHVATITIFNLTLQIGGPALLLASAICFFGQPAGLWIDAIASLICGGILLLIGGYWIIVDHDLNDFLITIFALMLLGSGRRQLSELLQLRAGKPGDEAESAPARPAAESDDRPATHIPQSAIPNPQSDSQPPDGYLAALGRAAKERHDARDRKDSAHGS